MPWFRLLLLLLALANLLVTSVALAASKTYQCTAVDKSARVGAWSKDTVDLATDKERRECRFSVNGAVASSSRAHTYECTTADKSTKVSVWSNYIVDLTADKEKRECRFSVNGADVGSPPVEKVIGGLNRVIAGGMVKDFGREDVRALAYSLIASSTDTELRSDLLERLQQQSGKLAGCFKDFGYSPPASSRSPTSAKGESFSSLKSESLSAEKPCLIVISGGTVNLELEGFGRIGVQSVEPLLVIAVVRSQGVAHALFIPRSRIGGPQISIE